MRKRTQKKFRKDADGEENEEDEDRGLLAREVDRWNKDQEKVQKPTY